MFQRCERVRTGFPRALAWGLALAALATGFDSCSGKKMTPEQAAVFSQAMNQGRAWLENKDSGKALAAFGRAAQVDPESPAAQRNLARAYLLARKTNEALATLGTASKLEGSSPATEYLTGITLARAGKAAEAIPHLEKAARLDSETAAVRFQLAAAYQSAGKAAEAEKALEETVRLDPDHATAYYRLARATLARGDRASYERYNQQFLRLRQEMGGESRSAEQLEVCRYTLAEVPEVGTAGGGQREALRFEHWPGSGDWAKLRSITWLGAGADGSYWLAGLDEGGALRLTAAAEAASKAWQPAEGVPPFGPGAELLAGDYFDPVAPGSHFDPARDALMDLLV
ncbi:MAG TPA: tetratricopeptide repeat protein, partial [Thermoanaerobaculia bacterium]|nr:tetratricopeptide repeat protein [Thermoanaerobaculia bacterium]